MLRLSSLVLAIVLVGSSLAGAQTTSSATEFKGVEPQPLGEALNAWARQTGLQVIYGAELIAHRQSHGAPAGADPKAALAQIVAGTGLTITWLNDRTASLVATPTKAPVKPITSADTTEQTSSTADERAKSDTELEEFDLRAIPEILVQGSRVLNTDIQRTRDDVQPYVVFDRAVIERSGAHDLLTFMRDHLTSMNGKVIPGQSIGGDNTSAIDLRGLGARQTLILVDGHRLASKSLGGFAGQPDLNGIPLSAIERIEVLATTASGIYGGGATGGVVNIVLRRDYAGVETRLTYGNSFDGGGGERRIDLAAGFNLEDGKTNILFAGSYSDGTGLRVGDRRLFQRGRAAAFANSPSFFSFPPLGATTNISSVDGTNLTLLPAYGGETLTSSFTSVPSGYAGVASDDGAGLAANAGSYDLALAPTVQTGGGARQALLSAPKVESLGVTVRRSFTSSVEAFLDLSASRNSAKAAANSIISTFYVPAGSAGNPFAQDIYVTTPALGTDRFASAPYRSRRATTGVIVTLPKGWRGEGDYTWARTKSSSTGGPSLMGDASAAIASGQSADGSTFDVFRDTTAYPVDFSQFVTARTILEPAHSTLNDAVLRVGGPLSVLALPAGAPTLAFSLENRRESLGEYKVVDPSVTILAYPRSQTVNSAYAEASIPLVSSAQNWPGVRSLDLQLAVRRDEYKLHSSNLTTFVPGVTSPDPRITVDSPGLSSVDPTYGLRWQLMPDVTLRASYGTGFIPPDLSDTVPGPIYQGDGASFLLTDPRRGNETLGVFDFPTGGNPDLRPEESTSRSAGIILTPRFAPGLRMSLDWTRIKKRNNVALIDPTQENVNNELLIPGFIVRGPPSDGYEVGPIIQINNTLLNIARETVEAYDLAFNYRWETGRWGSFELSGDGSRRVHNQKQILKFLPVIENALLAPEWKATAAIDWDWRQWRLNWTVRYLDRYFLLSDGTILPIQGSRAVASQTYHDVQVRYQFNEASGRGLAGDILSGLEVQIGVRNIFDKDPPFDASSQQFYSTYGDPRGASYYVSLTKSL